MARRGLAVLLLGLSAVAASERYADLADLESRIEYAWFTEDANGVRSAIQQLEVLLQKSGPAPALHYLLAFAHYRQALLLAQTDRRGFAAAMRECAGQAQRYLDAEPRSAEGHALRAVCQAGSAMAMNRALKTVSSAMSMDRARELDPRNPRLALLEAVRRYEGADAAERAALTEDFRTVLRLFEEWSARHEGERLPGWGQADAYAYLGRCLEAAGDVPGARNAYERALILAPDYAAVKRALGALLGRT